MAIVPDRGPLAELRDLPVQMRRGVAAFTLGWRQFWQGYWQSPHAC